MNDSIISLSEIQLNIDDYTSILAVLDKYLLENGLVILKHNDKFSVVNKAEKGYVELSTHATLPDAYETGLNTLVEGVIWEATNP